MKAKNYVKQFTQPSQEIKPLGVERQVLLHTSLRAKNDRLAREPLTR